MIRQSQRFYATDCMSGASESDVNQVELPQQQRGMGGQQAVSSSAAAPAGGCNTAVNPFQHHARYKEAMSQSHQQVMT